MKSIIASMGVIMLLAAFFGCGSNSSPTDTGDYEVVFDPSYDMSDPPDGGQCPNIYYLSSALLSNGVTVTWRSAFGGFDYVIGSDYTPSVKWSVNSGSTSFISFGQRARGKTFTPRGSDSAEGSISYTGLGADSLVMVVNMSEMHWAVDPGFQGNIGNGHFWLILNVSNNNGDIVRVKLGVNAHLEDPDTGVANRCPSS